MAGDKITIYISNDNIDWIDNQIGSSRSWKINQVINKVRAAASRGEVDRLLDWLLDQEKAHNTIYVLAMMDGLGSVNRGVVSLTNLLRTFLKSEFGNPMEIEDDMAAIEQE